MTYPIRYFKSQHKSQGMVEFALVMPMLLMLIYGVFEVGRVIFVYSIISTAAREAVRYGSATGLNVTGGVPRFDDCAGIRNAAQNVDFLGIISDQNIVISYDHGSSSDIISGICPPPPSVKLVTGDRIKVQVSGDFVPIVPIIPWSPWTVVSNSSRTILLNIQILGTVTPPFFSTYTPRPTSTQTEPGVPTNTHGPHPTHTPFPTPTASDTPTPGPPTPTPFFCAVTHSGKIPSGTDLSWIVHNPHVMAIEVTMLRLEWAIPNILTGVWFNNEKIFTGNTKNTGMLIPLPGTLSLPPGVDSTFRFTFEDAPNNIRAEILLNTLGCTGVIIDSSK
jgi:hypothetical protein